MYEPTRPALIIVKSRLSPAAWNDRVGKARQIEETMKAIGRGVDQGMSINGAIREFLPAGASSMGDAPLGRLPPAWLRGAH
jgi:hypothetical protein